MDHSIELPNEPLVQWPDEGVTRVPFQVYTDPAVYAHENLTVYRGRTWNFLALEAEIPEPGDFKLSYVGPTPVIVCRGRDGKLNAMVNRCSHRGSMLCFEPCGNRKVFTCAYHNWSFNLEGDLVGVAFRNGVKGEGGMPDDFDTADHNLEQLQVESFCGLIFGTFQSDMPSVEDYIGPDMAANIRRIFNRPIKIIGQYSQMLENNWKLIFENFRDSYHASILHLFFGTFGLNRLSMEGGIKMDDQGWHSLSYSKIATDDTSDTEYEGGKLANIRDGVQLNCPEFAEFYPEFEDGITTAIQTIFPTLAVQQIQNCLAVRQLVPRSVETCELFWTIFGYADDTEELDKIRARQSNLGGPAGYVSMEDGAAVNFVQRGIKGQQNTNGVIELGGSAVAPSTTRTTETTVRGFWKAYRETTGF